MNLSFIKRAAQAIVAGGKVVMPYVLGITARTKTTKDDVLADVAQDTLSRIGDLALMAQIADEALVAASQPGLTGQQKSIMIATAVRELIAKSELMAGKEIIDETRATAAYLQIQTGVVELLKSVKER